MSFVGAKTPINVNFTCQGNEAKVSLTADNGDPAWVVETVNREIRWKVKDHVTINGIVGKNGQNLPIDTDPGEHGGGGGKAYKAKVKDVGSGGPQSGAHLPYSLDVTCRQDSNTVRLIIDPEFIVRP